MKLREFLNEAGNNSYRIQIKFGSKWKTGIIDYTKAEAELAKGRMLSKGVQCRIIPWYKISD